MTTYTLPRVANTGSADTFMTAKAPEGEGFALAAVKGKAIDKASNALKQGADMGAMLAAAPAAARKIIVQALGADSTAKLGQQVAHADYRRAIASVAGVANHAFSMYLEPGKGPSRADWLRLGAELKVEAAKTTPKGNISPAAKLASRGLELHRAIQAHADELRAVAEAARKAQSVHPEEMAQRALTQA